MLPHPPLHQLKTVSTNSEVETVYGYKRIINLVNKNGFKTKKGNLFGINSIKTILEKPTYDGFIDVENIRIGMK